MKKKIAFITVSIILSIFFIIITTLIISDQMFTPRKLNKALINSQFIDICRNLDYNKHKLTSCGGRNNELVLSLNTQNELYNTIKSMFIDARIASSNDITTLEREDYDYKVVFKDKDNNILMGIYLGCNKPYLKFEKTGEIYMIYPSKKCLNNYKNILDMLGKKMNKKVNVKY